MTRRRRLRPQRRLAGPAPRAAWIAPAGIIGASIGVGGLAWLIFGGRAQAATSTARARDPWNLSPPVDDPRVTSAWGEPRAYRCPCDTEAPFKTRTKCKTSGGVAGFCSYIPIHEGLDFAGGAGKELRAMGSGVIVAVDRNSDTHAGRSVAIDYGRGLSSSFLHMSKIYSWVSPGLPITRGVSVGLSGSSGAHGDGSFAPHLHTTMRMLDVELYKRLFGVPKGGFGSKTSLGYAVPAEPLVPGIYSDSIVKKALARGVAPPRQMIIGTPRKAA